MFSGVLVTSDGTVRLAIENYGSDPVMAASISVGLSVFPLSSVVASVVPGEIVVLCDGTPDVARGPPCDVKVPTTEPWVAEMGFQLLDETGTALDWVSPQLAALSAQNLAVVFKLERVGAPTPQPVATPVGWANVADPTDDLQCRTARTVGPIQYPAC